MSSSSLFPLPIPPCITSPSELSPEEGIIATDEQFFMPEGSPVPSYFEAEEVPPSPTVAASEEALSEGSTEVEEGPVVQPLIRLPKDLEVRGWVHLQHNLVNHVIRRIHDNLEYFPALALQFEGQDTIFGEDRQALKGLHIVCRRLERDVIEQAAAAGEVDTWDKYFNNACRRADILQAYNHILRRN